jgi:hypothetical protein
MYINTAVNVYLISNLTTLEEKNIPEFNDDDLIVLFNTAFPLHFDKIKNHKKKWIFLRHAHQKKYHYHGTEELICNQEHYSRLFLVYFNAKSIVKINLLDIPYNIIFPDLLQDGRSFSTGYIGYKEIKKIFPTERIILINFTGTCPNGTSWDIENHNMSDEQNLYREENVEMQVW